MTIRPGLPLVPLLALLLAAPPAASQDAKEPASSKPAAPSKPPAGAADAAKAPAASKARVPEARSLEYARGLAPLESKAAANEQSAIALRDRVEPLADERRQVQAKIDALKSPLAAHLRKADLATTQYNKAQEAHRLARGPVPSAALLASARAEYAAAQTQIGEMKRLLTRLQVIEAQLNDAAGGAAVLDTEAATLRREIALARTRWRSLASELDTLSRTSVAATARALESSGHARAPAAKQRLAELDKASALLTAELAEAKGSLAALEKSAKETGTAGKQEAKAPAPPEPKPAQVAAKEAQREAK
jgi:chromosome segregation ATPase